MIEIKRTMPAATWDVRINADTVLTLTSDELDALAMATSFRLGRLLDQSVQPGPTGVELVYSEGAARVHLCYSDEAEGFAKAVMAASGLDEVAA